MAPPSPCPAAACAARETSPVRTRPPCARHSRGTGHRSPTRVQLPSENARVRVSTCEQAGASKAR
eukprot:294569-Prorocentrum_minimum.AAC.1